MAARRNLWKADFEMSKKIELEFISEPDIAKHLEAEAVELKKGPSSAAPSLPTTRDDQLKKKAEYSFFLIYFILDSEVFSLNDSLPLTDTIPLLYPVC